MPVSRPCVCLCPLTPEFCVFCACPSTAEGSADRKAAAQEPWSGPGYGHTPESPTPSNRSTARLTKICIAVGSGACATPQGARGQCHARALSIPDTQSHSSRGPGPPPAPACTELRSFQGCWHPSRPSPYLPATCVPSVPHTGYKDRIDGGAQASPHLHFSRNKTQLRNYLKGLAQQRQKLFQQEPGCPGSGKNEDQQGPIQL